MNYSTTSSVIGLNDFAQYPQVDFGASEIGYSTNQANNNPPASFSYQYLPDIAGATCLDYNLTNQLGQTDHRSQAELRSPGRNIHRFHHCVERPSHSSPQSGSRCCPAAPSWPCTGRTRRATTSSSPTTSTRSNRRPGTPSRRPTQSPAGPAAIWPTAPSGARTVGQYNFSNWTGENGSDNASNYVYSNADTITYVETGYALLHNDPCAAVTNSSGANVKPSETADAVALQNDQLQSDLEQNLGPVFTSPQAGAYAISAYSYLIMAEQ